MACLFLRNVPPGTNFDPTATHQLYEEMARGTGVALDQVQVHLESVRYDFLQPDGTRDPLHGVHGFVEWHKGRSLGAKREVALAIQRFLDHHGLGQGFDLAFRDYPKGESFFFEGELVG